MTSSRETEEFYRYLEHLDFLKEQKEALTPCKKVSDQPKRILLLGMVNSIGDFSKATCKPQAGQLYRDKVRIKQLVIDGYLVFSMDNKHATRLNPEGKHCQTNFCDLRRMKQSMYAMQTLNPVWGDLQLDHIILDYFFSPVFFHFILV